MMQIRKGRLFFLIWISLMLAISIVQTHNQTGVAVSNVSYSKEPSLIINPVVDTDSELITSVDEFDSYSLENGTTYLLTISSDYFQSYLTLNIYSPDWVLQDSISVLNRSESLFNPQIRVGNDNSYHVTVGIKSVGYFYLFSNDSGEMWFQTFLCPDEPLIAGKAFFELDELNQPHFAWLNRTQSGENTLEYMYPTYIFTHISQINATYHNSTLNSSVSSEKSEFQHSFGQDRLVIDPSIIPYDLTFVIRNLTRIEFILLSSINSTEQNGSKQSEIDRFTFDKPYSHSNFTVNNLNTYNITLDENSTIIVEEWSNTTTMYSNLTSGAFSSLQPIVISNFNNTISQPRIILDSLNQTHLFWLENINQSRWWLRYNKFNPRQEVVVNNSYTGQNVQIMNQSFSVFPADNFIPHLSEEFEGLLLSQSSTGSLCLTLFKVNTTELQLEPIYVYPSSPLSQISGQQFLDILSQTVLASVWDPLQLRFNLLKFVSLKSQVGLSGQSSSYPHFSQAFVISAELQYIPKNVPSNLNESIDLNYSAIVVSDQTSQILRVGISNFYADENCSCNITLRFNSASAVLSKKSPETYHLSSLQNGTVHYFEWDFSFLEEELFQRTVGVDIYSGDKLVQQVGFYVIVIPGINILELTFFIVGLMAFSLVFYYYKRIR